MRADVVLVFETGHDDHGLVTSEKVLGETTYDHAGRAIQHATDCYASELAPYESTGRYAEIVLRDK